MTNGQFIKPQKSGLVTKAARTEPHGRACLESDLDLQFNIIHLLEITASSPWF
jgi:hypothetical protein